MATKKQKPESTVPDGFSPLTRSRIDGWFIVEAGNQVQGILRDSFDVPDRFKRNGTKRVFKIEITSGETKTIDPEGVETSLTEGLMVGLDEKGWLASLADVEKGREVFVKCLGRGDKPAKPGQQPPWLFALGVK
jgi:hypothetical protein